MGVCVCDGESQANILLDKRPRGESKYFWRCISRCSCRESIPTSSRGRQRLKNLTVLQYIYKSIMGVYSGVKGQHWGCFLQVKVGRGGDLLTEGSGTRTQSQNDG